MTTIHITDIEAAINYWRTKAPSSDGLSLPLQLNDLAASYAVMVVQRQEEIEESELSEQALHAWHTWYDTTPDTPCIAICSTSQGDEMCKGCGRTFGEVQFWPEMGPAEKRIVWRRITQEANSWRFNRYSDRAVEKVQSPPRD